MFILGWVLFAVLAVSHLSVAVNKKAVRQLGCVVFALLATMTVWAFGFGWTQDVLWSSLMAAAAFCGYWGLFVNRDIEGFHGAVMERAGNISWETKESGWLLLSLSRLFEGVNELINLEHFDPIPLQEEAKKPMILELADGTNVPIQGSVTYVIYGMPHDDEHHDEEHEEYGVKKEKLNENHAAASLRAYKRSKAALKERLVVLAKNVLSDLAMGKANRKAFNGALKGEDGIEAVATKMLNDPANENGKEVRHFGIKIVRVLIQDPGQPEVVREAKNKEEAQKHENQRRSKEQIASRKMANSWLIDLEKARGKHIADLEAAGQHAEAAAERARPYPDLDDLAKELVLTPNDKRSASKTLHEIKVSGNTGGQVIPVILGNDSKKS